MINGHHLHIMAKPADAARRAMAQLEWMSDKRLPDALHWTVIPDPLDERWTVAVIKAVVSGLDVAPFTLVFDQARGRLGGNAEIYCRRKPPAATRLVETMRMAFERAGLIFTRKARPHVTLDYAWTGGNFDVPIAPIVWEVDRIQLVESITRRRLHECHAEWALVPRQGTLFPLRSCAGPQVGIPARLHG